jgi:sulfite dehydrogenase (quinone) subunit SoeC
VSAVLCFVPFVLLCAMRYAGSEVFVYKLTGIALSALSVITVICTAMIYHSLKTVPAWRHPFVPLIYLLFAGVVGRLLFLSLTSNSDSRIASTTSISIIVSLLLLYAAKKIVWKDIERLSLESLRASALGLPAGSAVRVFEHPHTEANFISKEMLFVLARKHAAKLRSIAALLFAGLPIVCMAVLLLTSLPALPWLLIASCVCLAGCMLERWLFFAEAKHVVSVYY